MNHAKLGHVCYFDPVTYPAVYNSANILVEKGWQVDVIGLDLYGFAGANFSSQVRLLRCGGGDWTGGGGLAQYVRFIRFVRQTARERRWDVVFGHDMMGFLAARLARVVPAERVAFWSQDLAEPARLSPAKRCLYGLKRHFLRTCPLTIAPSAARADAMRTGLPLRGAPIVVYNSPRRDVRREYAGEWRERLGVGPKTLLGVYAGGIGRNRYVPELVESVRLWPPNTALVVAGYGRDDVMAEIRAAMESPALKDRVSLVGHLPSAMSLIAECDFGFSLFEMDPGHRNLEHRGLASNKFLECLALGKPVAVSPNSETEDFIRQRQCGVCVATPNPEGIARAVASLLGDLKGFERMGANARLAHETETHFEKRFDTVLAILAGGDLGARS